MSSESEDNSSVLELESISSTVSATICINSSFCMLTGSTDIFLLADSVFEVLNQVKKILTNLTLQFSEKLLPCYNHRIFGTDT